VQRNLVFIFILFAGKVGLGATDPATGKLHGTVYTSGSNGEQLVVPGAHVKLSGPSSLDIQTDGTGSYSLSDISPGVYSIEVTTPGLRGSTVATIAGETTETKVQLQLESVKISVDVSDSAPPISAESMSRDVVGEKVLNNAPNKDERFDSVLTLIPFVVRGPDGLIRMKGARAPQGGSLLNGANVTDAVAGSPDVRLPIDVVSSAEVIPYPYDPEYGRLTGAVARTETRTGNYEGFHASFQNILPRPRKRGGDFVGIESLTPRLTVTGPLLKDKLAFTQSLEYRYVRTGISTQPPLQRDSSELEASLRSFDSRHPRATRKMFWLDIGCQLLLAAEVVALLVILRIPFHAGTIFAFDAANRAVKMLTGWMPARLGADEGASAGLFAALGLASGAGLALALTRRSRDLLCCAAGSAWLTWHAGFKTWQRGAGLLCKP
jgi:hypothetical protein